MPRGPKGEKGPADVTSTAVMVAKIATGEVEEEYDTKSGGPEHTKAKAAGWKGTRRRIVRRAAARHRSASASAASRATQPRRT